jgi:hypothetical protein
MVRKLVTTTFESLGDKVFKPRRWIVPGLITEGVTVLAGSPKSGKSWLSLNIAVACTTNATLFGSIAVAPTEVLYLALEDSDRRIQERTFKMLPPGGWPAALHLATVGSMDPLDQGGVPMLLEWLDQHPRTRLIILDTIGRVKPDPKGNSGIYQHDTKVFSALQAIALERKLALVAIHHDRKETTEDIVKSLSGSYGLAGTVDCIMVLKRKRRLDYNGLLIVTGRDVEEQELPLRFDRDSGLWYLIDPEMERTLSQGRQDILRVLLQSGRPMYPKEVALALGKDGNWVRVTMWRMRNKEEISMTSDGTYTLI